MSDSFGGKVRVSSQSDFQQIDYTSAEIAAGSFTGVKKIDAIDVVGNNGEGRGVEVIFEANEPMNIAYIAVEGEE